MLSGNCSAKLQGGGEEMPPIFKTLINIAVWILFLKGCLAVVLTLYTVFMALINGEAMPMMAAAGCAVVTFAFIMACVAA